MKEENDALKKEILRLRASGIEGDVTGVDDKQD